MRLKLSEIVCAQQICAWHVANIYCCVLKKNFLGEIGIDIYTLICIK